MALVLSTVQSQIIRLSPSHEPRRINSEHILRHHTDMMAVKVENHYLNAEIAGFPCVPTLGEKIDAGEISKEEARIKFAVLNQKILDQGYYLADGQDMNSLIPRENIGVFDDGEFTVLDGGMYSMEDPNFISGYDGSREFIPPVLRKLPAPEMEKDYRVSESQLKHMKNRGLEMGKFSGTILEKDLIQLEERSPRIGAIFRRALEQGDSGADIICTVAAAMQIGAKGTSLEDRIKNIIEQNTPTQRRLIEAKPESFQQMLALSAELGFLKK